MSKIKIKIDEHSEASVLKNSPNFGRLIFHLGEFRRRGLGGIPPTSGKRMYKELAICTYAYTACAVLVG